MTRLITYNNPLSMWLGRNERPSFFIDKYRLSGPDSNEFRILPETALFIAEIYCICMYIIYLHGFIYLTLTIVLFLFYFIYIVCIEDHMLDKCSYA